MGHHSTACKKNQQTLIAELEGDKKGRLKREDKKQRKTQHVSKERAKKEKQSTKKKKSILTMEEDTFSFSTS